MNGESSLKMVQNNTNAIPNALARALQHWACYICDVNRSQILNEGSIKYAISEYLEIAKVIKPENINSLAPIISDYKFEYTHPIFVSRSIDLKINYKANNTDRESYYEFKYARERNISKSESARFIDDIFRLASIVVNGTNNEAYFLLMGPKQHIENLLNTRKNVATIKYPLDKEKVSTEDYKENIRKMLSLDKDAPAVTFKPSDLNPYDEMNQIDRFNEEYSNIRKNGAVPHVIQEGTLITTELIHTNSDFVSHDDIIVNVWRISTKIPK